MRIISWNVNGFRAVLKKDFKEAIKDLAPDVLCLQEVKATEKQVSEEEINIDGYKFVWNSAEKLGYSGTATYIKNTIPVIENVIGLGIPEFDIEGRVICSVFPSFDLYNIYFPNGQRGMDRVEFKINFYSALLEICKVKFKMGKNIVITGDFNTAHKEIDLANPKENEKYSGFLPEEREWITKFIDNGFTDVFRTNFPEKIQYTWWTYRFGARARGIGWRIDYYLVSNNLLKDVKSTEILDSVQGSDHCPILLEI
jgi:exodeoxyribonuclease-3